MEGEMGLRAVREAAWVTQSRSCWPTSALPGKRAGPGLLCAW